MIQIDHVTKRYGDKVAVEDLTFTVKPGIVTGFLGPNGAGKSTTMRMIVGLDRPNSGSATVNGRPYRDLPAPLRQSIRVKLETSPHAERTLAVFEGEEADETTLGRIFGEELPSGLVLAEEALT